MPCLELTIVTLELSTNLLVPQAFACQVLIWLVSQVLIVCQWQKS